MALAPNMMPAAPNFVRIFTLLPVLLAVATFGCASDSYRHVSVSVIDSKTREPVQHVRVSTSHPFKSWSYRIFHPGTTVFTGKDGIAFVQADPHDQLGPIFDVKIVNKQYDQHFGYGEAGANDWADRPKDFIPTKPDIVLEVTSRIEEKRADEEQETKHKSDEEAAEKLYRDSPDYWPGQKADPDAHARNEVDSILISKRWERASKTQLGSNEDTEAIRAAIIQHMKHPQAKVHEIRWISPTVVMAKSSWYSGPLAAAGYTYVLRKNEQGWTVIAHYMEWVS
jgi:hypothetical protein